MKTFIHKFVDLPKMKTEQVDGQRVYLTPTGNQYTSVTSLTSNWNKKAIAEWRDRVGHEKATAISTRAANRGTSMHKLCEDYLHNRPLALNEENVLNKSMFVKIQPLIDRLDNIRVIEGQLYSDELKLAGTTDCIAEYKDELAVVDFKTSSTMKKKDNVKNYWMQGAAYAKMFQELYGEKPSKVILMISVESAPFPQIMIEPFDNCYEMLLSFMQEHHKV